VFSFWDTSFPNAPKWFFGGLLVIAAAAAGLHYQDRLVALVRNPAAAKVADFPDGCVGLRVATDAQVAELRMIMRNSSVEDINHCNPRTVRKSKVSSVVDVAPSRIARKGSRVTVALKDGFATMGVKDGVEGNFLLAVVCEPKYEFHVGDWGTLVPEAVRLTPETDAQGEIAMICRDGL